MSEQNPLFEGYSPETLRKRGTAKWTYFDVDVIAAWVAEMLAAFEEGGTWLAAAMSYLDGNRRLIGELLAQHLPEVGYRMPEATYFAWLDCRLLRLDEEPGEFFLERARVAISPGPPFGELARGFVRFNFATPRSILEQAVKAMATAVHAH